MLQLLCHGTSTETSFHPEAEWTSQCVWAGSDCSVGSGKPICVQQLYVFHTVHYGKLSEK
jgi:hypothetical protein